MKSVSFIKSAMLTIAMMAMMPACAQNAQVVSVTNQHGKDLVNATLTANVGENFEDGDIVTHIYVTFDKELAPISGMSAKKALANAVSLTNTTTGQKMEFNQYSCGIKSGDTYTLDLFLSTSDYINNADYIGTYQLDLPEGLAKTADGYNTEAYSTTFTYSGETTSIKSVCDNGKATEVFSLQGHRLSAPGKGINIINGKKTILK